PANVSCGSASTEAAKAMRPFMSAMPPIATQSVRRSETPRRANRDLTRRSKSIAIRSPRRRAVAIVDGLELAPVDGDARVRQKANLSAKGDKLRTHLA